MTYQGWIKSDEWKKIARNKLKQSGFQCELCGTGYNLQVHHITYEHIFAESEHMDDLAVLCKECHEQVHGEDIRRKREEKERLKRIQAAKEAEREKVFEIRRIMDIAKNRFPERQDLQMKWFDAYNALEDMFNSGDDIHVWFKAKELQMKLHAIKSESELNAFLEEINYG